MMYKKIISCIFVIVLASSYSCKTAAKNNETGIPKKMPDDFSVEYTYTGGMMAIYRTIKLKTGECKDTGKDKDGMFDHTFTVRGEALEELYTGLRDLDVFSMKAEVRGKVYDRGGTRLSFTVNKKVYIVDNSDSSFILQQYEEGFKAASEMIKAFADKHRNGK